MNEEVIWQGPHESPFVAASKALVAANVDTVEFSTYDMWNMAGEYPFFSQPEDFVRDLCGYMGEQYGIVVQRRDDGFYATLNKSND